MKTVGRPRSRIVAAAVATVAGSILAGIAIEAANERGRQWILLLLSGLVFIEIGAGMLAARTRYSGHDIVCQSWTRRVISVADVQYLTVRTVTGNYGRGVGGAVVLRNGRVIAMPGVVWRGNARGQASLHRGLKEMSSALGLPLRATP